MKYLALLIMNCFFGQVEANSSFINFYCPKVITLQPGDPTQNGYYTASSGTHSGSTSTRPFVEAFLNFPVEHGNPNGHWMHGSYTIHNMGTPYSGDTLQARFKGANYMTPSCMYDIYLTYYKGKKRVSLKKGTIEAKLVQKGHVHVCRALNGNKRSGAMSCLRDVPNEKILPKTTKSKK